MVAIERQNLKLGKLTNFNAIFLVMGSNFWLNENLKTRPSLHLNSGMDNSILLYVYLLLSFFVYRVQ